MEYGIRKRSMNIHAYLYEEKLARLLGLDSNSRFFRSEAVSLHRSDTQTHKKYQVVKKFSKNLQLINKKIRKWQSIDK